MPSFSSSWMFTASYLALGVLQLAAQEPVPSSAKSARPEAPPGFAVLDESLILPLTGLESRVFLVARSDYLAKAYGQAARELRKAASLMRLAAASATPEGSGGLEETIRNLDALAAKLESGDAVSAEKFDRALGLAQLAFARGHYMKANSLWARKMDVQWAGQHIKAAAIDLHHAATWIRDELEPEAAAALEKGARTGERLSSQEVEVADEDVVNALGAIEQQLHDLGRTLTEHRPAVQPPLREGEHVPGWIVLEVRPMSWLMPEVHLAFERARDQHRAHHPADAAKETGQAIALLRIAEAIPESGARAGIGAAIEHLAAIQTDLLEYKDVGSKLLESAYARAELALATADFAQARACWSDKDQSSTGGYLRSATQNVRKAAAWQAVALADRTEEVLQRVEDLAAALIAGDHVEASRVEKDLVALGNEISKLVSSFSGKQ